jgi:metal transporter CNNM
LPYVLDDFTLVLIAGAGLMSGLTVGYMGIDSLEMEAKEIHGTPEEKLAAARIRPLLANHHLLLATLLLGNALCFEALPIFMDAIMPSWLAVLLATTVILVFGEVLPQALCTGPQQIQIAASVAPLVNFLITVSLPVTYFIAKGLDKFLGVHGNRRYDRKMLVNIIGLHVAESSHFDNQITEETKSMVMVKEKNLNLCQPMMMPTVGTGRPMD